jgi:hypothetical protein
MGNTVEKKIFSEDLEELSDDLSRSDDTPAENILNLKTKIDQKANKATKAQTTSTCFYKVSNHLELYKIGNSFLRDYKNGYKSFAISSTGYHTSQQQTILGIASFFDHNKEPLNILIISDNIFDGTYRDVISASTLNTLEFEGDSLSCEVHSFYNHFDFLDLHSLSNKQEKDEFGEYDKTLDLLFNAYDIVLWDVPELQMLEKSPQVYFPVITRFDCLSIVVSNNISKSKDVEKICNFFSSYGLSLKGLLIDSIAVHELDNDKKGDDVKRSWWRRLFS